MELTQRKKQILKIVVDSYINTAEPVGSKAIVALMPEKVSSATVRNELADLTDMGYLEQPHTSAGRIPSAKGYRLYVNELMDRKTLSAEEEASINTALAKPLQQVEQVIDQAGQMVSSFVGYPTYAVADHRTAATVQRFELIGVDASGFIAVVMLSDSRVKSQLMRTSLPVEAEALPQLSHLLNTHFTGVSAEQMNATLMNLSEQVSGQWFLILNQVTEYAGSLLEESNHQQVYTSGASQLLKFPEFRDIDKAHDLMSFMVDNKQELPVPAGDAPMQILIGPENVNDALKESSVVIASYDIGDNMRGLVGVVGPTRMDCAAKEAAPEAAESAAEAAETTEDTYTVTKAQMEQMEALAKTLADANDKYLRLAAEYDNYRKRTAREKEHLYNDAKIDTIKPFLAVLDNLERGVSQFEEGDAHRQGLELICKQFEEVLTKLNVAEIPALGEKFDPEKHNAVMHTEDETAAENTVVEVFQKGYTLGDKILRFAMVKVAN